jgi:hypothetical protein
MSEKKAYDDRVVAFIDIFLRYSGFSEIIKFKRFEIGILGEAISALQFCRADFCYDHYAILRLVETIFPLFIYLADI